MNETTKTNQTQKLAKPGKFWIFSCFALFFSAFPLAWLNNTTQLSPDDSNILAAVFLFCIISGVLGGIITYNSANSYPSKKRISLSISIVFLTFLCVFVALTPTANIIDGMLHFPSDKTVTFNALLPIGRAYKSDSKSGKSWTIQPTPLWSNIDITNSDWNFMLARRRPWDSGADTENISSRGYFCARVTMQKSGNALRVIYKGNYNLLQWTYRLPTGSIEICPASAKGKPYLPY